MCCKGADGASGSGARGGAGSGSGARLREPTPIRPRSTRKKKPTLKSVYQL